ncbi:MAG TPA: prephenate dehydratase [Desulfomonilaceae bacterium]|nr:prephenate dehydratase [Desulfomonilaceae bacterium]
MDTLEELRSQIDEIDRDILKLLNRRMKVSYEIGRIKAELGQDIVDPSREEKVLVKLASSNRGPLLDKTLKAIYREIFSGSRALQSPLTVAFFGPIGTYTHEAAVERFGHSAGFLPCSTIGDVFEQVMQDGATFGVVPVENSIEGSVRETLDRLMTSSVGICGEISLRITHALMNLSGKIEDVRQVMSHPQALAQCRQWLTRTLPAIPLVETSTTVKAAEHAVTDKYIAAVGSERLAVKLGLQAVSSGIQDRAENITRFLVLGRMKPPSTGHDKTSIVFWTEDKPGALFKILERFAMHGINLSRIQSRPDRGGMPWKYAFFVDLEGHRDDSGISACLKDMSSRDTLVKVLGSFPVHSLPDEN